MTEQLSGKSVGFTNHNFQDITILELTLIAAYFFCFLGKLLMQTLPILCFCKKNRFYTSDALKTLNKHSF